MKQNISEYTKNIEINLDATYLKIENLYEALNNIPKNIKKIEIVNSFNILKREHVLLHECDLNIENTIITNYNPTSICDIFYNKKIINTNILERIIPEDYLEITDLFLDYNYNKFVSTTLNFGEMLNIKRLIIKNSLIKQIPLWIAKLKNIYFLGIINSRICKFPDWLCNLNTLQDLSLQNNCINVIPDSIEKLSNLQRLNLSENNINYIPSTIINLKNLKYFLMYRNPITEIEQTLHDNIKKQFPNFQYY